MKQDLILSWGIEDQSTSYTLFQTWVTKKQAMERQIESAMEEFQSTNFNRFYTCQKEEIVRELPLLNLIGKSLPISDLIDV